MNNAQNLIPVLGRDLLVRAWVPGADGPSVSADLVEALSQDGLVRSFADLLVYCGPTAVLVETYALHAVSGRLAFAPKGVDLAKIATATRVAYGVRDNRGCRYITERLSIERFERGVEDGRITIKGDPGLYQAVVPQLVRQLYAQPGEIATWWVSFLLEPDVQALAILAAFTADRRLVRGHGL